MASEITVENSNEVIIPVKKSHSRNSAEKRKEIEERQARIKARLENAEKTSSIDVISDVGEVFGKDVSEVYSKATEAINKYANETSENIYDTKPEKEVVSQAEKINAEDIKDPVALNVISELAKEVVGLRKTVSMLTETVDKLYQIQLAGMVSDGMLDKIHVNGKHDKLEVVVPDAPKLDSVVVKAETQDAENSDKPVEAVVVTPVVKNPYGDIAIAVVTGDMITGSGRIDDPNVDGGAKYFEDMYMNILKNKDSKGFLIDILKSRVSSAYRSPVQELADDVKRQHDMETVALLKLQLEELERSVLQKKEKKETAAS